MAKSFYDRVKEAAGALGEKKDDVVVVGTSSVTAVLVPDSYEDEKLRGKVIVSTYNGDTRDFAYYVASSYVKNPDAGDNGVTLIGKKVEKGESLSETIFGQYRNNGPRILISRDSTYDEEVFKKNASLILNAIDKSIENYKQNSNKKMPTAKIKKSDGESSKVVSSAVPYTWGAPGESKEPADSKPATGAGVKKVNNDVETQSPEERGDVLTKIPVENKALPKFTEGEGDIYGYWEIKKKIRSAIIEKAEARPYRQAVKMAKFKVDKIEKTNERIEKEIRAIDNWLYPGADASEKERTRREKASPKEIAKREREHASLIDQKIKSRNVRIYAVKNEDNDRVDFFVYTGAGEFSPKKVEDFANNREVFKIRKVGLQVLNKRNTPVIELYESKKIGGKMVHSEILNFVDMNPAGNPELLALCKAFAGAEKAIQDEKAFENGFFNHISPNLANDLDEQKNKYYENLIEISKDIDTKGMTEKEKKKAEKDHTKAIKAETKRMSSLPSGFKGGFLKTGAIEGLATAGIVLAFGLGGLLGLSTAFTQIGGGIGNAKGANKAREIAEAGGRTYISAQLKTNADEGKNQDENQGEAVPLNGDYNSMTNSAEPTLFNYKAVNTLDNVVIDTSRPSNMAELFMGENAETYGYDMQTDIQAAKHWAAPMLVTNWGGIDYTIDGINGAYWALGAMAGQEVKEHGVKVDLNNVVYPNSTTDRNSFVKALKSLGMTEDEAVEAAKSYTRAFQDAYIASENLVSVEPEEEITYNLADGQLDETLGALLNKDVDIISVNYDNATNSGIVYALADNGELIKTSFSNGEDYYVEVNNTSGVEAAILDAFDKAEEVENNKDAENDGEVANDKEPSDVVKEEEKTSAEDFFKVVEYAPVAKLNLESKKESKLYDYFGETYGNSLGLFYSIKSNKGDDGKAYYSAEFASVGAEDLNITHAGTDVYSTTTQTTTQQKIIYCAIQAISNGECSLGPAPGLHTGEGGKVEEYTVTNHLSNEDKVDARLALIGDGRVMMTTPSATSKDDERVR